MKEPLISIVMPTFNRAHTIKKSIKSVVQQTHKNWELIIVDDGSTDDTKIVVDNFNDERLKHHKLDKNYGCHYARKYGVNLCDGDYLTFLDSDDTIHIEKFEKQLSEFQSNQSIDVVLCNYYEIREKKKIPHNLSNYYGNCLSELLISSGPVFHTMLINLKRFTCITQFMNDTFDHEWDFLIRLANEGAVFSTVDEYLADWIVHENSISANATKEAETFQLVVETHKQLIQTTVGKKYLSDHYRRIARLWESANNLKKARLFYRKAFIRSSINLKNVIHFLLTWFAYPKIIYKLLTQIRKIRGLNDG
ncbi:MAG: glycosyltransferase family 2 protein [Candidatus Marinimicrobia bacterium]|nr:glycosyltransferase family 2 protein [Candidatus Neomarinimicrobiota bacterium]MBL7023142.1 glycosyltransferase family 2 protein [Candidatus Neomarinimicrobiota bacterium]MBL7109050.1 glycosyltransferase family 2 protein [Candidatus Neomarinimicrobiota bacterium]